jgi:membrane protein YqaA with SNARE-associated domain
LPGDARQPGEARQSLACTTPHISKVQHFVGPVFAGYNHCLMRELLNALLGYFLTPAGLVALAALDSSLIFFLPLGIDFAVVILSARNPDLFWLYAILAMTGSVIGAGATFWIGRVVGEHGLTRLIRPTRLRRIQKRVRRSAAVSVGALAMIPPPFPFTAFVLTSGALGANPWSFLLTLAGARLLRFAVESALAARYGRRILVWMDSTIFEAIVGALIVLALVGTVLSVVAVVRSTRRKN